MLAGLIAKLGAASGRIQTWLGESRFRAERLADVEVASTAILLKNLLERSLDHGELGHRQPDTS